MVSTKTSHLRNLLLMALGQEQIGERIKRAREDADLTQQQLADRVGVKTGQSVSRWERGTHEVPASRLRRIADETRKPLSYFVREIEGEATPPGEASVREELRALRETQDALLAEIQALRRELQDGSAAGSA